MSIEYPMLSSDAHVTDSHASSGVYPSLREKPLIGIAIPAFKREGLLARLLDTIPKNLPIVISDNGGHLTEAFKARYAYVRFECGPEVAMYENWNRAANAMDAEWIVMPGDDDLYFPDSFAFIVQSLRAQPDADIIFFGHHIIDENDQIRSSWQPIPVYLKAPHGFNQIRRGTPARPPGIVFKAELFRRLGGFCEEFKITAGDNDFYQRAALLGNSLFVDKVVTGYRVWEQGATKQTIATAQWLSEVDLWCTRVRRFAAERSPCDYSPSLRDTIYLDNLRAGICVFRERAEYGDAWRHFLRSRYPLRARVLDQFKLILSLVLPSGR